MKKVPCVWCKKTVEVPERKDHIMEWQNKHSFADGYNWHKKCYRDFRHESTKIFLKMFREFRTLDYAEKSMNEYMEKYG